VARRVEETFKHPFVVGEREMRIGVSIGISCTDTGEKDAAQLIREADRMMYRAKRETEGPGSATGSRD
jgi:diguanylate cyclase (GGDEF)-like protein